LTQTVLGYTLGDFLTSSSGHPGHKKNHHVQPLSCDTSLNTRHFGDETMQKYRKSNQPHSLDVKGRKICGCLCNKLVANFSRHFLSQFLEIFVEKMALFFNTNDVIQFFKKLAVFSTINAKFFAENFRQFFAKFFDRKCF
jgi:hypothetical protein